MTLDVVVPGSIGVEKHEHDSSTRFGEIDLPNAAVELLLQRQRRVLEAVRGPRSAKPATWGYT